MDLSAIKARPTNRPIAHPEWVIVLGGGAEVWYDVDTWERLAAPDHPVQLGSWQGLFIAVNDIGVHWPRAIDHWVSCHADKFDAWKRQRAAHVGYPRVQATWGCSLGQPVDFVVSPWAWGSSGMLAVQVALELGCTKVILCGVPMTVTAHFGQSDEFNAVTTDWRDAEAHWSKWAAAHAAGHFGTDVVRSMSGRTRRVFGAPTLDWLEGR